MAFIHDGSIPDAPQPKDPDSTVTYAIAWDDWIATGVSIGSSLWILPSGLTAANEQTGVSATDSGRTFTKVNAVDLSGGDPCFEYVVTNRMTTNSPIQTEDRSFKLKVRQK